jgi:hypothetical protein
MWMVSVAGLTASAPPWYALRGEVAPHRGETHAMHPAGYQYGNGMIKGSGSLRTLSYCAHLQLAWFGGSPEHL